MKSTSLRVAAHALMVIAVTAVILSSCSTEECYDNRNALPYAGFYGVLDGKMSQIRVDSMEVYGVGAPGDSVLHPGHGSISDLYLPFRIDSDTTEYVFSLLNASSAGYDVNSLVRFVYDREARFVSSACGVSYVYNIKEITCYGTVIDSVVCPDNRITNADVENLKIYFNTGERLENE